MVDRDSVLSRLGKLQECLDILEELRGESREAFVSQLYGGLGNVKRRILERSGTSQPAGPFSHRRDATNRYRPCLRTGSLLWW